MDPQELEKQIKEIIAYQLGVESDKVTPSASFIDDLGVDSLDMIELVMKFEDELDIEISDEDAEKITTVKGAIEYIKGKK